MRAGALQDIVSLLISDFIDYRQRPESVNDREFRSEISFVI